MASKTRAAGRRGDWLQIASGRQFYPLDPRPEEIEIRDIAHALSHLCRFGGHCSGFYSVAEHSVRVSHVAESLQAETVAREQETPPCQARPAGDRCDREGPGGFMGHTCRTRLPARAAALWGLLHDASEAYLGDVVRPIKKQPEMACYLEAEARLMAVICERFGLPEEMPASVARADEILLATEARDLMGNHCLERWSSLRDIEPLPEIIKPWHREAVSRLFLARFRELTR